MTTEHILITLLGGGLIGLSAVSLLGLLGRVAGISGILGAGLRFPRDGAWRWLFLLGLPLGALLYDALIGTVRVEVSASTPILIVAGLLVGYGTRLGSGCTSGHGVCGVARGSKRSIVATAMFMLVAILTVAIVRHWS